MPPTQTYHQRLTKGLCGKCGAQPVQVGLTSCVRCQPRSIARAGHHLLTLEEFERLGTAGIAALFCVSRQTAWRWQQEALAQEDIP